MDVREQSASVAVAIFTPSALVGAISGGVGGLQFLSGAGGNIVRARPGKRSQKTPAMLNEQAIYINAVRHWQRLTDAQRLVWDSLIQTRPIRNRLGVPQHLPGFQSFMKVAIPRFHIAGSYPNQPAVQLVSPPAVRINFADQTAASITFNVGDLSPFDTEGVQVFAGFSVNHTVWKTPRRMRLVFSGQYDMASLITLIPTWPSDFSLPVTGWRIFIQARYVQVRARPGAFAKADFIVG